jgi:hypothetical protein
LPVFHTMYPFSTEIPSIQVVPSLSNRIYHQDIKFWSRSSAVALSEEEDTGSHIKVVVTSLQGLDGLSSVCSH